MAIIRDRYYPLLFDEGKLAVADEIIDEEFVNHRHPKDWPTGPEALKKVVRELNAMHGGGLNNLHTEVVEIFVRGHNEIYALTHQTGVHNGNDVMPDPLPSLPPGTQFDEIQLHHWKFNNRTHKICSHEVQFWATANDGKQLRSIDDQKERG